MPLIAFLAPDGNVLNMARSVFNDRHNDIVIEEGLLSAGVNRAASLVQEGIEIIIARGGTASAIRRANLPLTVVEIPITGFDIIRTVEKAEQYGRVIAVVAFPSMIEGIECLSPILKLHIRLYPIQAEWQAESQVLLAFKEGADVVIGGFITVKMAQKHGYPCALIESGTEALLQAAQEAKRIAFARNLEKTKTSLFRAVLDYAYEGIIAIDSKERITLFNPIASRITGIDGTKAIGRKISEVWPELKLEEIILQGKDELGHILKINDVDVLCNKVALMVNHKAVGAVVTFQDVTQIQKMEARVRRRIYASGHVASFYFDDIICASETCKKTIETAKSFAATQSSILIVGETGTGKEVFAQSIHNFSKRRQGPFVAVNCAALPAQILESELFGYVGGAFTGASQKGKPGLFEVAHGGTIFLDEIAEMEYGIQGKLLRVLQEKKVMRLGSDKVLPIDVHILAATNKNLKALVIDKQFRADLYYRLNVLQLKVPPLRKRKEDIALLAEHFLREHAPEERQLTESAIRVLRRYSWPGNVRELQNIIERAIVAAKEESIDADIISQVLEDDDDNGTGNNIITEVLPNEIEEIKKALAASKGKYKQAAALLGISRSTLWRKLKRLGLK